MAANDPSGGWRRRRASAGEYVWDGGKGLAIPMVWVPPGKAILGSDDGRDNEKPRHERVFAEGFYVARCPTTVGEYPRFVAAMAQEGRVIDWPAPGFAQDDS